MKKESKYSYEIRNGWVQGDFNVYQGRNGKIYLVMGGGSTSLTDKQVEELNIDLSKLIDFDYQLYKSAYNSIN